MASYPAELTTDIPEHSFLDAGDIEKKKLNSYHSQIPFFSWSDFWDERARGLGATTWVPV